MARVIADKAVDLIILDLKLGNEDGLDLKRGLGAAADVPVILVAGHRREEPDRVIGLELGADDYLTKPFGLRELLARVRDPPVFVIAGWHEQPGWRARARQVARAAARHQNQVDCANVNAVGLRQPPECKLRVN